MTFAINVAADVSGKKINLTLPFHLRPSFIELQRAIEAAFVAEQQQSEGAPTSFEISALQIYNEGTVNGEGAGWDILRSCAALSPNCQLYAFQRSVAESSFDIPSPRAPRVGLVASSSTAAGAIGRSASAATSEAASNAAGDAILAAHIQRRGTSPPRPSGLLAGGAGADASLLRAAAPAVPTSSDSAATALHFSPAPHYHQTAGGRPSGASAEGAPYVSAAAPSAAAHNSGSGAGAGGYLPHPHRAPAPTAFSAIEALNATSGGPLALLDASAVVSAASAGTHNNTIQSINTNTSANGAAPPTAASSLVTLKQKLFADPNPTVDHKVRTVFDELDARHARRIEISDFLQTLADMRVTLAEHEAKDIFIRADRDHDGAVSFAEFEWLSVHYPTLVDALYFRLKEAYEERRRRDVIESRRRAVDDEVSRQSAEAARAAEVRRRVEECESQLLHLEQEQKTRAFREKEATQKLTEAKREADAQKHLRSQREADVAAARDNEKQRHANLQEAQQSVASVQKKVSELESELQRSQEKESQLEAMLEAARKETDGARRALQSGVEEARQWRDHERAQLDMFSEAQKEVQKTSQHVVAADAELDALLKFAAACEDQLMTAQRETALAAHRAEQQQQQLAQQAAKSDEHVQMGHTVAVALEKARAALEAAERDLSEFRQRRLRIEAQEKPLIEQEVALRAQRFALEEQETMHRYEKVSFYSSAGRPPAPAAPSAAISASASAGVLSSSTSFVHGGDVVSIARSPTRGGAAGGRYLGGGVSPSGGGALNRSASVAGRYGGGYPDHHQHQHHVNASAHNIYVSGGPSSSLLSSSRVGPSPPSGFPLPSPAAAHAAAQANNAHMQQQFYRANSSNPY